MPFIHSIHKHLHQLGTKINSNNIHQLGHKILHHGRVIGRKINNTLHKIEDVGKFALPIVSTAASMLGHPELGGAINAAEHGLKKIAHINKNVHTLRNMLQ